MTPTRAQAAPGPPRERQTSTPVEQTMTIIKFLAPLACLLERRIERGQQQRDDAYLAQATDHADLEFRQRQLAQPPAMIPHYG